MCRNTENRVYNNNLFLHFKILIHTMKLFKTLAVAGLLSTLLSCNSSSVKGDGNMQTEQRPVTSFNKIDVSGDWEVILTQGESESVKLEADKNLLGLIETKVEGGDLVIGAKRNKSLSSEKGLKVYLTFKNLNKIELSGDVKLSATTKLTFDKLQLEGSGSAELNLDLNANQLDADMNGSSKTMLKGRISEVLFTISGEGSLSALELNINKCTVDISGDGNASVCVKDELNTTISGSGSVQYKGSPLVKKNISGDGNVSEIK